MAKSTPVGRIKRNLGRRDPDEYVPERDDLDAIDPADGGGRWPEIQLEDMPSDILLRRLRRVRQTGHGQWRACCPSHPDTDPSLSVTESDDGKLLLYCWSGPDCTHASITEAVGLTVGHLFPTSFARLARYRQTGRPLVLSSNTNATEVPVKGHYAPPDPALHGLFLAALEHPDRAERVEQLAGKLGVECEPLDLLDVGWDGRKWVIPETDDLGTVVGLSYRYPHGRRWQRGRRGLLLPRDSDFDPDGTLYLPEGASDVAALLSVGELAIGRPMALEPEAVRFWLVELLRRFDYTGGLVVVGDDDKAGRRGAEKLARHLAESLRRMVRWGLPADGHEDVREQVRAGHWGRGLRLKTVAPAMHDQHERNEGS